MEKLIILILGEATIAILIFLLFSLLSSASLYQKRYVLVTLLAAAGLVNLLMFVVCIYHKTYWNSLIFFLETLFWAWWFEKQSRTIGRNRVFVPKRIFKEAVIKINGNTVELTEGPQVLPWPWFTLSMKNIDGHSPEVIAGFDADNNIINIESFIALSKNPNPVGINEIEVTLEFQKDYADQINLFSYKNKKGQDAIVSLYLTQITDSVKYFVGKYTTDQLDTSTKVDRLLESNGTGSGERKALLDKINKQVAEFTVKNAGNSEPLMVYKATNIRFGEIKPPKSYLDAKEQQLIVGIENNTKDAQAAATKKRATDLGITLTELLILEGKIQGFDFGGKAVNPLVNINPTTKK